MAGKHTDAMHVDKISRRHGDRVYTSYVIRSSYREGGKVKHDTIANISRLPQYIIDVVDKGLAGEPVGVLSNELTVEKSWAHGHVAAVVGTAEAMGLAETIEPKPSRQRDLVMAMIAARVLKPASKLATTRWWGKTSLARTLGVQDASKDEVYQAMDWLLGRQSEIEGRLASRYLEPGGVVMYDLTSVYLEGQHCSLAARGYSRDGKPGHLQIEFGLMTNAAGDPVAVEAFPGNTADPKTFLPQAEKVKDRFGVGDVIWVADRGMATSAQLRNLEKIGGLSWVTAMRGPTVRSLVDQGAIQLSLFDTQNLFETKDPRYPGERLVVCYNPVLGEQRARKREDMLQATERQLVKVKAMAERGATGRGRLRGAAKIGERVGRVINKYDMAKHFRTAVNDSSFSYERNQESIGDEARLDGLYVIRTNVPADRLDTASVVRTYKGLQQVERAFRHFKLRELEVRPVYHYRDDRVRAHLLICMLAYAVQRRMEQALAPLLFMDEVVAERPDPVAPARRSQAARHKDGTRRAVDGLPLHSFRTLLEDLAGIVKNRIAVGKTGVSIELTTIPTVLQRRAFELLGVGLGGM